MRRTNGRKPSLFISQNRGLYRQNIKVSCEIHFLSFFLFPTLPPSLQRTDPSGRPSITLLSAFTAVNAPSLFFIFLEFSKDFSLGRNLNVRHPSLNFLQQKEVPATCLFLRNRTLNLRFGTKIFLTLYHCVSFVSTRVHIFNVLKRRIAHTWRTAPQIPINDLQKCRSRGRKLIRLLRAFC